MFILKYSLIQILDILGYADSSKVRLNETGVVHDAKVVFRFLKKLVGNSDEEVTQKGNINDDCEQ